MAVQVRRVEAPIREEENKVAALPLVCILLLLLLSPLISDLLQVLGRALH
jgi:hypothetical protein